MTAPRTSTSALHPEHLADLERSGLSRETIAALGIYSARPHDIPRLLGWDPREVTSALVFPYPGEDFVRAKVFPPFVKDGHTVKYLQRPRTGVHFYIPPAVGMRLKDPSTPLAWTEGEKKAAKLCQEGVPAIGLGGLWMWIEDGNPIEKLDAIAHVERDQTFYPDSDVWTRPELLHAVYAFAKEIESRGANVTVAVLTPGPDGQKRGADDFVVAEGLEALGKLRRISLKHAAFSKSVKWWKRWTEAKEQKALDAHAGRPIVLEDPEPWPEEVGGAETLEEVAAAIRNYVAITEEQGDTLALWIAHAHVYDSADESPILDVSSPTKRCGKTLLLRIIEHLVPRPLPAASVTAAAVYRTIEAYRPTLLVDEADTVFERVEELRAVVNAGHTKTGAVLRTVGEGHEVRLFSAWCPKAVALIGSLPGTLEDRAIQIRMKRKAKQEALVRFRRDRHAGELHILRRKVARWTTDRTEALQDADPGIPDELHDRAADNWRPLLALAEAAGGRWPEAARKAATGLAGDAGESDGMGVLVLGDMRDLFTQNEADRLTTDRTLEHLHTLKERPWPAFGKYNKKPITARQLARFLRDFGISSRTIRVDTSTQKGYLAADFEDAFTRYLPAQGQELSFLSVTASQPAPEAGETPISYPSQASFVTDEKEGLTTGKHSDVTDVTDGNDKKGGVDRNLDGLVSDFRAWWGTFPDKAGARRTWPSDLEAFCREMGLGGDMLAEFERRVGDLRRG